MSHRRPRYVEAQYHTWPENTSELARVVDPARPWVSTPETALFSLPPAPNEPSPVVPPLRTHEVHDAPLRRRHSRKRSGAVGDLFGHGSSGSWFASLFRKRKSYVEARRGKEDAAENWPSLSDGRHIVTPAEWRAYGYWARPIINEVMVNNATPSTIGSSLSRREVEAIMQSLRDADGKHPERWQPRAEHPSLPPRPALWPTPPPSPHPRTAISDIQLNPFLQHRPYGVPPLIFDLRYQTHAALLGECEPPDGTALPMPVYFHPLGPNGAQPATYPGLPSLTVSCLADDVWPVFPWPFKVVPQADGLPVDVCMVLNALIANFESRMEPHEVHALSEERFQATQRAYWRRVNTMCQGRYPAKDDGFRRVDYLGDSTFFRGLEPAPDGDGFMLFLGPAP